MKQEKLGGLSDDREPPFQDPIALVHAFAKALAEYKANKDV